MKGFKALLCVVSISLLLTLLPASAQDMDPPAESTGGEITPTPRNVSNETTLSIQQIDARSTGAVGSRTVHFESNSIPVAASPNNDEEQPAIAHGGGYYMIAYIFDEVDSVNGDDNGDNVKAVVFDDHGNAIYSDTIFDGHNSCSNVSIAYEYQTGYFVVVFEYSWGNGDIYGIIVSPSVGVIGSVQVLANSSIPETSPSVACNPSIANCLVAFEYNNGTEPIQGTFLGIGLGGIISKSAKVPLDAWKGEQPYLTWGNGTGTYLLLSSYWDLSEWDPQYNHLHDAQVPVTQNQYLYPSNILVPPEWRENQRALGVTYDPCIQKYLALFTHEAGLGNSDIYLALVGKNTASVSEMWAIANTHRNEITGDIHFLTDNHEYTPCGSYDQTMVTYLSEQDGLFATSLLFNSNPSDPAFTLDDETDHLLISANVSAVLDSFDPVISSGADGKMFIAWENYYIETGNRDVMGRMVSVFWKNYLPLINK